MVALNRVGAFAGGLLVGNSAPHLATAVTGRTHLTPLAGNESSSVVNLLWGLANVTAGLASPGRAQARTPAPATAAGTQP